MDAVQQAELDNKRFTLYNTIHGNKYFDKIFINV